MPLDDLGTPDDWQAVQRNWVARTAGEHPPDGGDPIVALRNHFEENVGRLSLQIERAEQELRSLQTQQHAFVAALQALDGQQNPQVIIEH